MAKRKRILVKVDTSWFDEKADEYFARDDFREFERLLLGNRTDLSLRDFHTTCMEDVAHRDKKAALQELWADKSIVATSVQDYHFGFGFPFLAYTHCFDLFEPPSDGTRKLTFGILGMDLSDSLRRRHIVLSQAADSHCRS
ncbi:MAG: hypothetical protein U5R49_25300 [Deltaproteobacteria bacterium]|nr:hypothetical protein [Deltaproteobacteria bacterium]